ncbi:MAG TPA: 5-formyltetrahydrofolate cyclo-ligase [Pyrinomonadaceae bacterium]|nr:5-formyltetrahydrofolate cyclo-ligase [Pyrinomonadaceae bacterium]
MTKAELRQIYLAKQKSLSKIERKEKSQQIVEQFFTNFPLKNIKNLHLFLSIEKNGEVETKFIYERIWRNYSSIHTFVPRLCGANLEHLEFTANTQLNINSWGITEPIGHNLVNEKMFDAVIVPLLCFDEKGHRVGYGKGFYDRFLAKCRTDCIKIGVNFFPPVENFFELNEFDVKLDFCLTPNSVWKF